MAAQFRAQLGQLATSGGSHRDLGDKYRAVLEGILLLGEDDLVDSLKVCFLVSSYIFNIIDQSLIKTFSY